MFRLPRDLKFRALRGNLARVPRASCYRRWHDADHTRVRLAFPALHHDVGNVEQAD